MKKKKTKKHNALQDIIKASRKKSRDEEIVTHGKPINYQKIVLSKKIYNRKKRKADNDDYLP